MTRSEPVSALVARHGRLPVPEACELVRQAALGLQAAHEAGLVHRDIKPSNLMLARDRADSVRLVIIDWGLVKRAGEVIPYVIGPVEDVRDGSECVWEPPKVCPTCGQPVERVEGEVAWYCVNNACPAQL